MSSSVRSIFINAEVTLRFVKVNAYLKVGRDFFEGFPSGERLKSRHDVVITVFRAETEILNEVHNEQKETGKFWFLICNNLTFFCIFYPDWELSRIIDGSVIGYDGERGVENFECSK